MFRNRITWLSLIAVVGLVATPLVGPVAWRYGRALYFDVPVQVMAACDHIEVSFPFDVVIEFDEHSSTYIYKLFSEADSNTFIVREGHAPKQDHRPALLLLRFWLDSRLTQDQQELLRGADPLHRNNVTQYRQILALRMLHGLEEQVPELR